MKYTTEADIVKFKPKRKYAKKPPVPYVSPVPNHIHYIRDDFHAYYRMWCSWNPGDMWDTIDYSDVSPAMLKFMENSRFFVADYPEDDSGATVCKLCKLGKES